MAMGKRRGTLAAPKNQRPESLRATASRPPSRRIEINTLPQYTRNLLWSGLT